MIQVEDKIISMDVFEKQFVCDLNACKGACCVEGDSGAPLTVEEEKKLNTIYEKVKPYMREEGISEIEKRGVAILDSEKTGAKADQWTIDQDKDLRHSKVGY